MKKLSLILATLGLFSLSLYAAFNQGGASLNGTGNLHGSALDSVALSQLVYTGVQAKIAGFFAQVFDVLMNVTGGHIAWAIVLLALIIELVLLYPSVRVQLKQKKIHLFHKKLMDKFHYGELSYNQTESEMEKLYTVNEKIHAVGAWFVVVQAAVFVSVFWGLHLMVKAPVLLEGSWSILNFSILNAPLTFWFPLLMGLLYFLHSLIKIYFKEKEDYISTDQTFIALVFAVLASLVIYFFAGTFAMALSIYFATLITFSTIRYVVVEQHAKEWGQLAQKQLTEQLCSAKPHKDKFEYFSRKWNHLPVVRYINFHLLEEALSMSLGLILALNFFGVFQDSKAFTADLFSQAVPVAYAEFPIDSYRPCNNPEDNLPICNSTQYTWSSFTGLGGLMEELTDTPGEWFKLVDFSDFGAAYHEKTSFIRGADDDFPHLNELPPSCCLTYPAASGDINYQIVKPPNVLAGPDITSLLMDDTFGCSEYVLHCADLVTDDFDSSLCTAAGCTWLGVGGCGLGALGDVNIGLSYCAYRHKNIPDVVVSDGCPVAGVSSGPIYTLRAEGGSGSYEWSVENPEGSTAVLTPAADPAVSAGYTPDVLGDHTITVSDANNPLNNGECVISVISVRPISVSADQPDIVIGGDPVELRYTGGPADRTQVSWELVDGPGELSDIVTGTYVPSSDPDDVVIDPLNPDLITYPTIQVQVNNTAFPETSATVSIPYTAPACNADFGIYDYRDGALALVDETNTKTVYDRAAYRLSVKNSVLPGQIEFGDFEDFPDSIVHSHSVGLSAEGVPYMDLIFTSNSSEFGDTFELVVWDPTISSRGSACRAAVTFTHGGRGVRPITLPRINLSF